MTVDSTPKSAPLLRSSTMRSWVVAVLGGVLVVMATPSVYRLGPVWGISLMATLRDLQRLQDADVMRGYYQDLNKAGAALVDIQRGLPASENWYPMSRSPIAMPVDDEREVILRPSSRATFLGVDVQINRWGMRDRDYEKFAPPGVFRAALLGPCIPFGWGVPVEDGMARKLEERLNRRGAPPGYERYEILNFAVGGHLFIATAAHFEKQDVLSFDPKVVFIYAMRGEVKLTRDFLRDEIIDPRSPKRKIMAKYVLDAAAHVPFPLRTKADREALQRAAEAVVAQAYARIGELARARGVPVIWWITEAPLADPVIKPETLRDDAVLLKSATDAGFHVISTLGLFPAPKDRHIEMISERFDAHPNALGHEKIVRDIYNATFSNEQTREILFGAENKP